MSTKEMEFASEVAALKFRADSFDVWKKTSLLREPLFWRAILYISFYGLGNGVIQFLYRMHYISAAVKDTFFPLLYLSPLIGGMYLIGGLNKRRAILSFIYIAIYSLFIFSINHFFYHMHTFLEMFQIIPGSWLIVWWVVSEPKLMNYFGLRKARFLGDLMKSLILVAFIAVYAVHFFIIYGFRPEFDPVKMAAYFSGNVITCMFLCNYCYVMRDALKKRGATTFQIIMSVIAVLCLITGPGVFIGAISGVMSPAMAFAGFIWSVIFTFMVMHFTFNGLKNSLSATLVLAFIMLLMKMAKIV